MDCVAPPLLHSKTKGDVPPSISFIKQPVGIVHARSCMDGICDGNGKGGLLHSKVFSLGTAIGISDEQVINSDETFNQKLSACVPFHK